MAYKDLLVKTFGDGYEEYITPINESTFCKIGETLLEKIGGPVNKKYHAHELFTLLCFRYGINGEKEHTLKECADILGLEHIEYPRQLIARAHRILRRNREGMELTPNIHYLGCDGGINSGFSL